MSGEMLVAHAFDATTGCWKPGVAVGGRAAAAGTVVGVMPETFAVVTFNVWFGRHEQERRWRALLDEVRRWDADVIAFQEVTAPFLQMLLGTLWVQQHYALSDNDGTTLYEYGVVMLLRVAPVRLAVHDLPTFMGRRLLVAEFATADGRSLAVAGVHLESRQESEAVRDLQFARCMELLSAFDDAVLLGDMNFCASWAENRRVPPGLVDVWPTLRPREEGYTEDTEVNAMLRELKGGRRKQVRFDRVFVRGDGLRPERIERLGTRPVAGAPQLFPSDHFGLFARFHLPPR